MLGDVDVGLSEMTHGTKVYILPLMVWRRAASDIRAWNLVVKEAQGVSKFRRVGCVRYRGSWELWDSWIRLGVNRTICLL
jgi:hypothetical protein